jgi:hypothetical protein
MTDPVRPIPAGGRTNRRLFLRKGVVAAGAATMGAGLFARELSAFDRERHHDDGRPVTRGDIAILTFLSALEQVEQDLWIQYAELGGATNQGKSPIDLELNGKKIKTGLAANYVTALQVLDMDMPQYIVDNTDDEITHHRFLNNYLVSKGAEPIDLTGLGFATLPPSQVTGVPQTGRLTNLKQLTVDTSWWTRYRDDSKNPDFGDMFENAVPDLAKGQHPAIPLTDDDLALNPDGTVTNHLQAIANTAGFHFGFIEQGGNSLYPSLAQRVTNLEVLRILLSIGPSETMHFQVWHDKAGNAPPVTDGDLMFPVLDGSSDPNGVLKGDAAASEFQANLIMPEPTFFLDRKFERVSIIRPTETRLAATGAVKSLTEDGLFIDPVTKKNTGIVARLMELAEEADEARRQ